MKGVKNMLLVTGLATLLAVSCPSFSKAATQEDVDYLIEATKKVESLRKYPEGFEIKALCDEERIGNLERNLFFSVYYYPQPDGKGAVPKYYITLNYITHNGDSLDIKQLILRDGHDGLLDGKPDSVIEDRIFETEVRFTYKEDGKSETETLRFVDDIFPMIYDLNNVKERERLEKVFDKAIDLFKLKSKGVLTEKERTEYNGLKKEIEELAMQGEYFSKTRRQLEQERES